MAARILWGFNVFGWPFVGADIAHAWWVSNPLDASTALCAVVACVNVSLSFVVGRW